MTTTIQTDNTGEKPKVITSVDLHLAETWLINNSLRQDTVTEV